MLCNTMLKWLRVLHTQRSTILANSGSSHYYVLCVDSSLSPVSQFLIVLRRLPSFWFATEVLIHNHFRQNHWLRQPQGMNAKLTSTYLRVKEITAAMTSLYAYGSLQMPSISCSTAALLSVAYSCVWLAHYATPKQWLLGRQKSSEHQWPQIEFVWLRWRFMVRP